MNTKMNAIAMTLLMIASALAGCTSGDPDGDDTSGIDMEILNEMIDDNLQDFINNTSVTVNNHYYNNTTNNVDSSDNSVSNYNGSGGISDSTMYMFTVSWDREAAMLPFNPYLDLISYTEHVYGGNHSEMPDSNDPTLLFERSYNGQMVEFRFTCMEFLSFSQFNENNWGEWLEDNYGYGPSGEVQEVSENLNNWYVSSPLSHDIRNSCQMNEYDSLPREILFEIQLESGQAMSIQVLPNYVEVDINCDDGYGTGVGNGTATTYLGGQSDCTITGSTQGLWRIEVSNWLYNEDGTRVQNYGAYYYDWYVRYNSVAPANFAVYFTIHDVEVYNLED